MSAVNGRKIFNNLSHFIAIKLENVNYNVDVNNKKRRLF